MQACATPSPSDRLAFANQLAEVRALNVKGKDKEQLNELEVEEQLNELEVEYQFILLRSLDLFHKEMRRTNLPEKLHAIKEQLCDTAVEFTYRTNLPFTSWNWNIMICRHCRKNSLKPRPFANELCCENCGLLEPLDGVAFDYDEIYKDGDNKVVKQRRSTRRYNFRHYLEKHAKIISANRHTLSCETIAKANEFFEIIEEQLPKRISMPFVAYKILEQIVQSAEEKYVLNYFWLQVPQSSVAKHTEKWEQMLKASNDRQSLATPSVRKVPCDASYQTRGKQRHHNACSEW